MIERSNSIELIRNMNTPREEILEAFGIYGQPTLLQGGQGTCYRIDNVVLKPIDNAIEASWIADVYNNIKSTEFRVPKPIKAKDDFWIFDGWIAIEFLEGEHRSGRYAEAIEISKNFHRALLGITKPDWFDQKTDVFSLSDRMAWGELPLPDFELTNKPFKKIMSFLRENRLPNQLIHGDWGPNQILFSNTLPPAVIDMTPYFRPTNYPIADMMISAIDHEGANLAMLDFGKDIQDFDQLLLRALLFRTCTYVGFQIHPENTIDRSPEIVRHIKLIDGILEKLNLTSYN